MGTSMGEILCLTAYKCGLVELGCFNPGKQRNCNAFISKQTKNIRSFVRISKRSPGNNTSCYG